MTFFCFKPKNAFHELSGTIFNRWKFANKEKFKKRNKKNNFSSMGVSFNISFLHCIFGEHSVKKKYFSLGVSAKKVFFSLLVFFLNLSRKTTTSQVCSTTLLFPFFWWIIRWVATDSNIENYANVPCSSFLFWSFPLSNRNVMQKA